MTSPIKAGPSNTPDSYSKSLIDAIDQVFVIFRVNYHNQYYKAFPDTTTLHITKKLWLESLRSLPPQAILKAAEYLVRSQDYLPTLSQMLRTARASGDTALPDVHTAFIEACQAPSPKRNYAWSHPLIYHAGQLSGWHTLATQPERHSFPIFRKHFEKLEHSYLTGAPLTLPEPEPETSAPQDEVVDAQDARQRLAALRSELKI